MSSLGGVAGSGAHSQGLEEWFRFEYDGPDGMRLDQFLRERFRPQSRTAWRHHVRAGRVLVNGRQAPASRRLRPGDLLELHPATAGPPPEDGGFQVLYEDDELLAVSKESGLLVHPVRLMTRDTVVGKLRARHPGIRPCHRLDKLTSGLLLLAKSADTASRVQRQFESGAVRKEYLALVEGTVERDEGIVDLPLGPDDHSPVRIKVAIRADGEPSVTGFRVLERLRGHTLIAALPRTGRKHQIRAHLAHLGHPVAGDFLYGRVMDVDYFENRAVNLARDSDRWIALHSHRLELEHPSRSGETLRLEAPPAPRFAALLEQLRGERD